MTLISRSSCLRSRWRRVGPSAALLGFTLGSGCALQPAAPPNPDVAHETFVQEVREAWQAHGAPGYAVAVAGADGIRAVTAGGVRRLGGTEPIEKGDVFHIGSVTKPMTAT